MAFFMARHIGDIALHGKTYWRHCSSWQDILETLLFMARHIGDISLVMFCQINELVVFMVKKIS